jgi:hypothetical protein
MRRGFSSIMLVARFLRWAAFVTTRGQLWSSVTRYRRWSSKN